MKTKVIYIAGQAYSGSTFMCALMGAHPQMEPVSELSKWTTKYSKLNRLCACGKKSKECEFWMDVEKHWLSDTESHALQRYVNLQDEFENISSIWLNSFANRKKLSSDFEEFETMTVSLYKTVAYISGRPIIIDSSKLPARALAISRMSELDVFIIHLVRSGLRYLESSLQREKKISRNDPNLLYKTFQLGLSWSATNLAAERALRMSNVKGIRVRYEDFVSNPVATLDLIGLALDMDLSAIQDHIKSNQPISYRHMASGSGHRNKGPKPIMRAYNTVSEIDWRLKLAFYLGAIPLSRRYGYI